MFSSLALCGCTLSATSTNLSFASLRAGSPREKKIRPTVVTMLANQITSFPSFLFFFRAESAIHLRASSSQLVLLTLVTAVSCLASQRAETSMESHLVESKESLCFLTGNRFVVYCYCFRLGKGRGAGMRVMEFTHNY